jgi:hypothetical protein
LPNYQKVDPIASRLGPPAGGGGGRFSVRFATSFLEAREFQLPKCSAARARLAALPNQLESPLKRPEGSRQLEREPPILIVERAVWGMSRSILFALFAALAILLASQRAPAESAPFPVEPSMVGVEDAFPVAVGQTELELSYGYSTAARAFDDGGDTFPRDDNAAHVGAFTAKHGFTSFLDAAVGIFGAYSQDDGEPERSVTGLGDLFVNTKWRFFGEGDDGLHLAYQPGLSIPVGEHDDDKNLSPGLGFWAFDQSLIATLIEGRWVGGVSARFLLPLDDRDGARGFASANLGLGYQLTPWLKPELELNYDREFATGPEDAEVLAATFGVILNLSDALRADLGFRHVFYGRNADRRLSVTAAFLWTF